MFRRHWQICQKCVCVREKLLSFCPKSQEVRPYILQHFATARKLQLESARRINNLQIVVCGGSCAQKFMAEHLEFRIPIGSQ